MGSCRRVSTALLQMDTHSGRLDERIVKLDTELQRYTEQMKRMKPGPAKNAVKQRALRVLKQRKMYEEQKDRTAQQQFNVEQIMFTQETMQDTAKTVTAMKVANKELKKQFKTMKIDDIEDLQDDMADLMEQSQDIQDALARTYCTDEIDEAELEDELQALEEDPSLFMSVAEHTETSTPDYLGLPAQELQLPNPATEPLPEGSQFQLTQSTPATP